MTDPAPHNRRVPHWGWWLLGTALQFQLHSHADIWQNVRTQLHICRRHISAIVDRKSAVFERDPGSLAAFLLECESHLSRVSKIAAVVCILKNTYGYSRDAISAFIDDVRMLVHESGAPTVRIERINWSLDKFQRRPSPIEPQGLGNGANHRNAQFGPDAISDNCGAPDRDLRTLPVSRQFAAKIRQLREQFVHLRKLFQKNLAANRLIKMQCHITRSESREIRS